MLDLTYDAPAAKVIAGATSDWELVIGLEVHAQVATNAKLFSGASTKFGAEPNSNVAFVDAGIGADLHIITQAHRAQGMDPRPGLRGDLSLIANRPAGALHAAFFWRDKGKPVAADHGTRLQDHAIPDGDPRADLDALQDHGIRSDHCVLSNRDMARDPRIRAQHRARANMYERSNRGALTDLGAVVDHG